jgi:predicted O-linked N-acetylglucosamine transferase (SPINDLY family)
MTPEIYGQQGMALAQQNRLEEALACLDQAVRMKPDFGEAHHNRGVILQHLGRVNEAVASYDCALRTRQDPGTYYNRGNALLQLRRVEEAVASFERALKLAPNNVEALMNRGYALMHLDRPAEALPNYERVLKLKPGYAEAHVNRGRVLARLNRPQEALASYDTALQLKPDDAGPHNDRGHALMSLGQFGAACAGFERALQLRPDYAEAWHNRGLALVKLEQVPAAIASFDRAARLRPGHLAALSLKAYQQARICDWTTRAQDAEALHRGAGQAGAEPFLALALDDDPASQFARSRAWAAQYRAAPPLPPCAAARPEKLRVGYFSADFRDHAMMYLMAGLFERHDRARFEVHLFSFGAPAQDEMRQRAIAAADRFHDVSAHSDGEIVALARAEGIDIAVDLMGYTRGSRTEIFAGRAAPIQVSHLGYPGTMGAPFIDYVMADKCVLPENDRRFYSEQVIHLPHSYFPTDDGCAVSPRRFSRAELGLPEQSFVFCCFNNSYKISPAEFDIWMRLLGRVEGSVLWLLRDNDLAAVHLGREAQARGIDPARLVFAGRAPHDEHLARHRCADLFLDTFNYNAHTTAVDALWAGLPLVTRPGRSFPARVAASLLQAIGLPELVTDSAEAYEQLALALATDSARLAAVTAKLAANRAAMPLFDTAQFTRDVESAYDKMYAACVRP